jgi:hypothetical protein
MNTLQNIYNKLAEDKTELAKHKVKLAKLDDLIKIVKNGEKNVKNFNDINSQLIKLAREAVKSGEAFRVNISEINNLGSALEKQFKDLGLNYLENVEIKKASALLNEGYNITSQLGYIKQIIK